MACPRPSLSPGPGTSFSPVKDALRVADGGEAGEEVAHHQTERPPAQEAYARVQRDKREDQVQYAPEDEVRVDEVTRLGDRPAGPPKRQDRAQDFEACNQEHDDGREGEHARPSGYLPARTPHGIADPSRHRFAVLRHSLSSLSLSSWELRLVDGLLD